MHLNPGREPPAPSNPDREQAWAVMTGPALSVNLMPHAPAGRLAELAAFAEQRGCRRVWVYDEGIGGRDVWVALTAIAAATERVLIGPGITNPYVRHPGATAAAVASLDELSGGRAFVGLGSGGALALAPLGIERRRPIAAVSETVTCLRELFAGSTLDFEGEHVRFRHAGLGCARTGIEIMLAGRGPRMIDLAARCADGFYLSYVHKDTIADTVAALRSSGRPFTVSYSTAIVTTDADFESARADLTFRLLDSPPEVRTRIGLRDGQAAVILSELQSGGPDAAARHVDPEWVSQFAVAGDAAAVAGELRSIMADNRIDEFLLPLSDLDSAEETIERSAALFGKT